MKQATYILILIFLIGCKFASAQSEKNVVYVKKSDSSNFLFLNKESIKQEHIKEIKFFYLDSTGKDIDTNRYLILQFNNGILKSEKNTTWFDYDDVKYSKDLAEANTYYYEYSDSNYKQLDFRKGNGEQGGGRMNFFLDYKYKKGKMIYSVDGSAYSIKDKNNKYKDFEDLYGVTMYYYTPDSILNFIIHYTLGQKTLFLNELNKFDSKLIKMYSASFNLQKKDSSILDNTEELSRKYYLYKDKKLIGYYPAKVDLSLNPDKSDTIYFGDKLQELKQVGLECFSKKYFKKDVYDKLIEDGYDSVKNKQLRINGKPIKTFLTSIKKNDANHIVFEIADNYFLFYKIIDE